MANLVKRVVATAGWDNRCPIDSDVAAQLQLAISNGVYVARAVTVSQIAPATMTTPLGGNNQIIMELLVPSGTADATIIALVTAAINNLNLPTAPVITVGTVTVF